MTTVAVFGTITITTPITIAITTTITPSGASTSPATNVTNATVTIYVTITLTITVAIAIAIDIAMATLTSTGWPTSSDPLGLLQNSEWAPSQPSLWIGMGPLEIWREAQSAEWASQMGLCFMICAAFLGSKKTWQRENAKNM